MAEVESELLTVAERLYAGSTEEFTEARNAAAKGVEKDLAAEIKKLKKPSVAAWAVNLLVRSDPQASLVDWERARESGDAGDG